MRLRFFSKEREDRRQTPLMVVAVFFAATVVYLAVGPDAPQGGDTVPNRYLPIAVLCKDLTLDGFHALWERPGRDPKAVYPYYVTQSITGSLVSTFGPVVPILSSPFYAVADAVFGIRDSLEVLMVSRWLSGLLCALAAALVFAACRLIAGLTASILATVAFAFGSGVFSVASRGLWQQTWSLPMLALGIFVVLRALRPKGSDSRDHGPKHHLAFFAGLAFAVGFACRPQTGLFLAAGGVALAHRRLEYLPTYCLGALPVLGLVFAYNTWHFDSPFTFAQMVRSLDVAQYKTGSASLLGARPWEAALGLLVSPSRGLFVFSPAFVLGLAALWPGNPSIVRFALITLSVAAFGLFVTSALWFDWWGGYTLSYRPLLDILPVLAILTAVGLERCPCAYVRVAFATALAWSVLVATSAALGPGAVAWNAYPDVDRHPQRLWTVADSLPRRLLMFRAEDRSPLWDSNRVMVVDCGVAPLSSNSQCRQMQH